MKSDTISRDDMDSMSRAEYWRRQDEQYDVFEILQARIEKLLERFGRRRLSARTARRGLLRAWRLQRVPAGRRLHSQP